MSVSLLSTKFYIPPPREDVVARPRLTEKVLAGVNRPQTFTLLSGPAGSGKTTLLSQFVTHFRRPVAWLSLDEADDDPIRFWTYLLTACQSVLDGVGESAQALLETAQSLPDDTVPTLLINDLAGQEAALVLLLDDFHVIHNPSIHGGFSFLIDHLPGNLHVVVSTRVDPPWPLSRYRARNQLVEIRARDLRFSCEEAAEFLRRTTGLNLSAEDVAALEARTEGWAAGLQLAAIAMQTPQTPQSFGLPQSPQSPGLPPSRREGIEDSDASAFVKAFTGSQRYVAEYLVEEVLRRQPEDVQTFLLQTSILRRLKAGLCDAVTGRRDGREMLGTLHRSNLFIIPLDAGGHWFRYHHLFADLLQARLRQSSPSEAIAASHLRAADWYEQNGFDKEAVDHALAANDFERVADLVKQAARTLIFSGRVNILRDWLEALPEASFQAHPHLTFYLFWIDLLQRKGDLSERAIQEMEELLKALPSSPENDRLRGEFMAVLCRAMALSGRTSRTIRLAQEALTYIPQDDSASRARAHSALAIAHDLEGRAEEAASAYRECSSQASAAGDYLLAVHTTTAKGLIQCRRGQLYKAANTFQTIIDMGEQGDIAPEDKAGTAPAKKTSANRVFFPVGPGYIGLASIHLEWNDLKAAEAYLKQGMDLCRRGGLDGLFIGRMLLSRLRQAQGDLEGASAEIQIPQEAFKDKINVATRQIQIRLARGDVEGAWRWAASLVEMLKNDPAAFRPPLLFIDNPEVSIARVYLAQGEIGKALHILDTLQAGGDPDKRVGHLIEIYLLRALACQKQATENLTPETIESIERALELGGQEGHVLLFLEEGSALIPLLQAVANRRLTPARLKQYAQKLLNAFSGHGKPTTSQTLPEAAGLVESLTPREMEVLQLIAAGHSNQAIAGKLFITVRTVKKHAGNIYGKLNVSRRTEAVARARELGLLPTDG